MQKPSYYQTLYRRRNVIMEALLGFFLAVSSWPRMLLEVPIRKHFGERYFNFATAMTILVILGIFPLLAVSKMSYLHGGTTGGILAGKFLTWYAYLGWFLYSAIQRRNEIKRLPSVFDFARFSLSTGQINRRFFALDFNGWRPNVRTIETVVEPGFFYLTGLVLLIIGQPLGPLLMSSSIWYSLSYVAAYRAGDNFLMDKIDERICNEELVRTFVDDVSPDQARGFKFYGRRPTSPDARRQVAEMFRDDEEIYEVV